MAHQAIDEHFESSAEPDHVKDRRRRVLTDGARGENTQMSDESEALASKWPGLGLGGLGWP
jgi:hypothetical protein